MYSYGPPHMAKQKQDDQLEPTYSSYVKTQDVTLKTCRRRWMIGRSGERGSGISVLAARHDDDDYYNNDKKQKAKKMYFCLIFWDEDLVWFGSVLWHINYCLMPNNYLCITQIHIQNSLLYSMYPELSNNQIL